MKPPVMRPTALVFFAALALLATSSFREDRASPVYASLVFFIGGMYAGRWMRDEPPAGLAVRYVVFHEGSRHYYVEERNGMDWWDTRRTEARRFATVAEATEAVRDLRLAHSRSGLIAGRIEIQPVTDAGESAVVVEPEEKHAKT